MFLHSVCVSNPIQAATASSLSGVLWECTWHLYNISCVAQHCLLAEGNRVEGKWNDTCAELCIRPWTCAQKEMVFAFVKDIFDFWFIYSLMILFVCLFELLKDVRFFLFFSFCHWSFIRCSHARAPLWNMLAFELVFEKKLHRLKHNNE